MDNPYNIVIVEDDLAIREATTMLLELSGYTVRSFEDLTSFNNDSTPPPDLYLVDRQLRGEDGLTLCTDVKSNPLLKHIPVIIMSASPETEDMSEKHGCDAFLPKPFTRLALEAVVARLLPELPAV